MRIQILRQLRRLHSLRASDPVEEDLRGWNSYKPPVKPRRYLSLAIADVAYKYCPTKRDVYLRKVLNQQGEQREQLSLGRAVHDTISLASREVSRLFSLGLPPYEVAERALARANRARSLCPEKFTEFCVKVYKRFVLDLVSDSFDSTGFFPVISEFRVDGSPLGLSPRLSVDAVTALSLVLEVKVGYHQDFHRLALAGYAMALESSLELPVDFGALIYVNGVQQNEPEVHYQVFYVSSDLRKEFLDSRDEVIQLVEEGKDPGKPAFCPTSCPFFSQCNPGLKAKPKQEEALVKA